MIRQPLPVQRQHDELAEAVERLADGSRQQSLGKRLARHRGQGGRHQRRAPLRRQAAEGVELAGVAARAPEAVAKVAAHLPRTPVFPSLAAMIDAGGLDAVTITTPPQTRRALVLEAIAAGLHVVADNPFAPSAEVGCELDRAAETRGVVLSVLHNRRWDADARMLARVLASGRPSRIWRLRARMQQSD